MTHATPGCVFGIERRGQPQMIRAYGSADLGHGVANTPETVFEAGSVSKQFTAAAILLLAADGRLSLNDDVRKYVPELPDYGGPITLEHLLTHTSGVRDWLELEAMAGHPLGSQVLTNQQVLRNIARQSALNFPPGSRFSYSNSGYELLAEVAERVSGKSLPRFTRERIFQPLGMTSTRWRDDFRAIVPRLATGYAPTAEGFRQDMPFSNDYGSGALLTTVGDLLIWNRALNDRRLGAFLTEELQRPGKLLGYARGVTHTTDRGHRGISHTGSRAGYRAMLARYPDAGVSFAMLCNTSAPPSRDAVIDFVFGRSPQSPPSASPEAAARAGLYVDDAYGLPLRLALDAGGLKHGADALIPISEGRWRPALRDIDYAFAPDGRLTITDPEDIRTYRRADPYAPSPTDLRAFVGRFRTPDLDVEYVVAAEENRLTLRRGDQPPAALEAAYRDAFTTPAGSIVRFVREPTGRVVGLRFGTPRGVWDLRFTRID